MATGYTYPVEDGKVTTLKEFTLSCARAFGACSTMKEESTDTPIPPEFKINPYHAEQLKSAEEKLRIFKQMSKEECEERAGIEHNNLVLETQKSKESINKKNSNYNSMLSKVLEWEPPTSEHKGLKEFMVEQLTSSLYPARDLLLPKKLTGEEWRTNHIKGCQWSIDYHRKEYKEECERVKGRNKWVKDLRDSLNKKEE